MKIRNSIFILIWISFISLITYLILLAILATYRHTSQSSLLFDQFLVLTFIASPVFMYFLKFDFFKERIQIGYLSKFLVSIIVSLFFFSTVQYSILAVDRSRSLYVFSWVDTKKVVSSGKEIISINGAADIQELNYPDAIQQRINEQISRKLMRIDNNEVRNSFLGNMLLVCSEYLAIVFNLNGWKSNT